MSEVCYIPVANPAATFAPYLAKIEAAAYRVIHSGRYVLGTEVEAFEAEFSAWLGAAHTVGVANGTDALELALRAVGVGPGDEVATVANTVTATVSAITAIGAHPRFVEIDPATMLMSAEALDQCLSSRRVKAVIPVHLYGHPADLSAICEVAQQHEALVVEDCAQAHGASWRGRAIGTWGVAAAFSFYPTKNLGCLGDGGAVVTNDSTVAERVRSLRQYGWRERYTSETPGRNSRLDEIQAAILRELLPHLANFNERRLEIATRYRHQLANESLDMIQPYVEGKSAHHQFVIRSPRRNALKADLQHAGIGTALLYPVPVHRQPGHAQPDLSLPHTEAACRELLCLPIYPGLTDQQVDRVAQALSHALTHAASA